MGENKKKTACPVCGFDLGFPPWVGDSPSDEICPCCGIQFGYEDVRGGEFREGVYRGWRGKWIEDGMKWWSSNPMPKNWNPKKQLENLRKK